MLLMLLHRSSAASLPKLLKRPDRDSLSRLVDRRSSLRAPGAAAAATGLPVLGRPAGSPPVRGRIPCALGSRASTLAGSAPDAGAAELGPTPPSDRTLGGRTFHATSPIRASSCSPRGVAEGTALSPELRLLPVSEEGRLTLLLLVVNTGARAEDKGDIWTRGMACWRCSSVRTASSSHAAKPGLTGQPSSFSRLCPERRYMSGILRWHTVCHSGRMACIRHAPKSLPRTTGHAWVLELLYTATLPMCISGILEGTHNPITALAASSMGGGGWVN